ncbi:MAG: dienelactone hydrolase family protein [Dehalococcoidia bacterium]|nr:dienelactone hydrolase family protein [Dehalococcoidia bacterium]
MKQATVHIEKLEGSREKVIISLPDGDIECIFHSAGRDKGIIWLCGALGGLDGPSFGIFRILSQQMVADGFSSLRLHYRHPGNFEDCVQDVLAGIDFLRERGVNNVALVGHSFGGAVAIQAGTMSQNVKAVVGLSSQTYGAQNVAILSPRPLLLIHGERDRNLSAECSSLIYKWANEPKELYILKDNGHFLREAHGELLIQLRDWLLDKIAKYEISLHKDTDTPVSG